MKNPIYPKELGLQDLTKAVTICLVADVPVIVWGPSGYSKSSGFQQLHEKLNKTKDSEGRGWLFYDFRSSDKEPTDLGGFPIPNHKDEAVKYYSNNSLPWEHVVGDQRVLLVLDEIDRASSQAMVNVSLQLLLDREVNGLKLGPNVRIVAAANGESSKGTLKLNEAALARCVHLYVDPCHPDNLDSFKEWSETYKETSIGLEQLLSIDLSQWHDFGSSADQADRKAIKEAEEKQTYRGSLPSVPGKIPCKAYSCPRSKVAADKLLTASKSVSFEISEDVRFSLVQGCIGKTRAAEFLVRLDFLQRYDIAAMAANPEECAIPEGAQDLTTFAGIFSNFIIKKETKNTGCKLDDETALIYRLPDEVAGTIRRTVQSVFAHVALER